MYIPIDIDRLRRDLINYLGTASYLNPNAQADLIIVERASDAQLIAIAKSYGFEMTEYAAMDNYDTEDRGFTR